MYTKLDRITTYSVFMTTTTTMQPSIEGNAGEPLPNFLVPPLLRAWQRLYRGTPNFRGKGRVLFEWPSRLIRKWPADVTIASHEDLVFWHCDLNEYLYRLLFFCEVHEIDVDWICRRVLKPGDVFVDIGANYGYHALTNSRRVGPKGRVYAFEPQPDMCTALRENARRNGLTNLEIENLALSDRSEQLQLHRFSSLGAGHTSIAALEHPVSEVVPCDAITMDEYVARNGIGPIAAVKLDVEGAELKILMGARELLRSPKPPMWIIEVNLETAHACGYHPRDLLLLLADFGYLVYRPVWGKAIRTIARVEVCPPEEIQHGQNVLCAIPSVHGGALADAGVT
jgi:FkbM family methyltransferase